MTRTKMIKFFSLAAMITLSISLMGCSGQPGNRVGTETPPAATTETPPAATTEAPPAATTETPAAPEGVTLTLEELKAFNGQDGQPAYVAVDGVIYDVSAIKEWKGGTHQNRFKAGNDLSEEIKLSPHGKSFLKKAVVVGTLAE